MRSLLSVLGAMLLTRWTVSPNLAARNILSRSSINATLVFDVAAALSPLLEIACQRLSYGLVLQSGAQDGSAYLFSVCSAFQ